MPRAIFPQHRRARFLTLALSLLATGCAIGPDYRRPPTLLPESFRSAPEVPAATQVDPLWWQRFNDPTLNRLVEKAQSRNFDLQAALARVEEAEGLAAEANATFIPQIDLKGSSTRTQVGTLNATPLPASVPRLQDSRKTGLSTAFEIDLWGKLRRASESARADLLASRYARDTLTLSITGAVVSTYITLRSTDVALQRMQNTRDSRQKTQELVGARIDAGAASPLEAHQAEASLAAADAQLADLRRQRALAENQLALLTGQPELNLPSDPDQTLPLPPLPPAGLPSALLEARPDIRQAEESLISANARIGVAKGAYFPSLVLTGSNGNESAALANLFKSGARVWSAGLAATLPLFDAGRTSARVDQATARQKQALAAYRKAVYAAFKDVNDALSNLHGHAQSDEAQQRRANAARETLTLAQIRYEAGQIGFLEVLDAQRNANDAEIAAVTARQSRLNAAVDLFKALGGGWKDDFAEASRQNSGDRAASPAPTPEKPAH